MARFSDRARFVIVGLLLAAAVLLVYAQAGGFPFITFDDPSYVAENSAVRNGLTGSAIAWAFTTTWMGNYHPLTWLSHMADVAIFGMDAGAHHLVNVLLHFLNTMLLLHVFFRLTDVFWNSALVAALFAVHPLHVESVAWVAERKDVLSAFFFLLTLWAWLRYAEKRTLRRYAAVFLSMLFGLMAKSMLVTLPFVLLLLDYWPLGRFAAPENPGTRLDARDSPPLRHLLLEKLPLLALSGVFSAVTLVAQTRVGATDVAGVYSMGFRVANAVISYSTYLAKTVWPGSLAVYYPYPAAGLAAWKVAAGGLVLALATAAAVWQVRRRPFIAMGWFWYLGTLVPVIGLVQIGEQAMADRYTYLPLIGIFVVAAWGIPDLFPARRGRALLFAAAGGAAVLALAVSARVQAGYWRNSAALYEHALAVTSDNWLMHNNLGVVRFGEGKVDEALRHYRESVRINPNVAVSNHNLGDVLLSRGLVDESLGYLRKAVALAPGNPICRLTLGTALTRQGKFGEAAVHLAEAQRLDPGNPEIAMAFRRVMFMSGARGPGR